MGPLKHLTNREIWNIQEIFAPIYEYLILSNVLQPFSFKNRVPPHANNQVVYTESDPRPIQSRSFNVIQKITGSEGGKSKLPTSLSTAIQFEI